MRPDRTGIAVRADALVSNSSTGRRIEAILPDHKRNVQRADPAHPVGARRVEDTNLFKVHCDNEPSGIEQKQTKETKDLEKDDWAAKREAVCGFQRDRKI